MKKSLILVLLAVGGFLIFGRPVCLQAVCPCQNSQEGDFEIEFETEAKALEVEFEKDDSGPALYSVSDPSVTADFPTGSVLAVSWAADCRGETKKQARILDQNHVEVIVFGLTRSGDKPYTYTGTFTSPAAPGTYYLDIHIESPGEICQSQKNFSVVKTDGGSPAGLITPAPVWLQSELTPSAVPQPSPALSIHEASSVSEVSAISWPWRLFAYLMRFLGRLLG